MRRGPPEHSGPPRRGSRPRKMFAPTSRFSRTLSSWWMNPMPSASASPTPRIVTGLPSKTTSPSSGTYTPPRIFMSVDLPAPFSPMSATTSPGPTDRLTAPSAVTPGKRLVMARSSSREETGGGMAASSLSKPDRRTARNFCAEIVAKCPFSSADNAGDADAAENRHPVSPVTSPPRARRRANPENGLRVPRAGPSSGTPCPADASGSPPPRAEP